MTEQWLPITEYSIKHKVSVSTLRRKIKTNEIKFSFEDGKYLLLDEPVTTHLQHRPSPNVDVGGMKQEQAQPSPALTPAHLDGPILTAANKLLVELKRAYTQILQEKEEQILHLREEVTDLKTLVRVLESENDNLKARLVSPRPTISF
jgi:hypothetical protein